MEKIFSSDSIIYIDDFILLVDRSMIHSHDWYVHSGMSPNTGKYQTINNCYKSTRILSDKEYNSIVNPDFPPDTLFVDGMYSKDCVKIIATIGNSERIEGIPNIKLDNTEEEIKELAISRFGKTLFGGVGDDFTSQENERDSHVRKFISYYTEGYNKSKKDRPFSEDDMGKFAEFLFKNWIDSPNPEFKNKSDKWLIKKFKSENYIKEIVLGYEKNIHGFRGEWNPTIGSSHSWSWKLKIDYPKTNEIKPLKIIYK